MTVTVTIDEAAKKLKELIQLIGPGDEVVIAENGLPIAKVVDPSVSTTPRPRPGPGLLRGRIAYMAPDFDAPLEDLKEYME